MLVLIEKPFLARVIDAHLRQAYPGVALNYLMVNAFGDPHVFDYPKNLSWHDYPFVGTAQYKLSPRQALQFHRLPDGQWCRRAVVYPELPHAQDAIGCSDGHPSDLAAQQRLRQQLEQVGIIGRWVGTFAWPCSLADKDVARALQHAVAPAEIDASCAKAALKADFEFSFLVNSAGLLTRAYRAAGGEHETPVFSKYTVQALYALRAMQAGAAQAFTTPQEDTPQRLTENDAVHTFARWPGTGRYVGRRAALGSATSRDALLQALKTYGLVGPTAEEAAQVHAQGLNLPGLHLTELGHAFLARLHPDCEDPDLPYRIATWQEDPAASYPSMQRYMRTWFGKQKRFMGAA